MGSWWDLFVLFLGVVAEDWGCSGKFSRPWLPLGVIHFEGFGDILGSRGSELRRRFDWSEIPLRWGLAEKFPGIPLFLAVAPVKAHAFCDILKCFKVWSHLG